MIKLKAKLLKIKGQITLKHKAYERTLKVYNFYVINFAVLILCSSLVFSHYSGSYPFPFPVHLFSRFKYIILCLDSKTDSLNFSYVKKFYHETPFGLTQYFGPLRNYFLHYLKQSSILDYVNERQ